MSNGQMQSSEYAMEPSPHLMMMQGLKERLRGITSVLPPSRPIVYLDYPVHNNVGDLLIHQGADAFLDDYGYSVLGRFSMHDFTRRGRHDEAQVVLKPSIRDLDGLVQRGCAIVLHGGGNFGDVWPQFQAFRELIIARYPETPIVILPQTIHFDSIAQRGRSARLLSAHRQLYIFVRDRESLAFLREANAGGELMPDMAHQLWGRPELSVPGPEHGTLVVRRRDRESRNMAGAVQFDWDELNSAVSRFTLRALRKWQTIDNPLRHSVPNYLLWRLYRDRLVARAVARFRPFATIDTDRLHGMILAALMNKEVRYNEGSYGKLQRYAGLWLGGSDRIGTGVMPSAAE
ncbi:MAG TPA: polysaccharide pyruvyl transferase family protein [Pseudolabrys sp.]|nr:polysaccharide pyruvyl transferase family protein [Pseudolabrys sp.]